MSSLYTSHWNTLLAKPGTEAVDILSSIREDAVNNFLQAHFRHDNAHYTLPLKRTFNANGKSRTFWLTLKVEQALAVEFAPLSTSALFNAITATDWTEVTAPSVVHRIPAAENDPTPNVRVTCPKLSLLLEWEKLDGSGKWDLKIDAIKAVLEAFIEVDAGKDSSLLRLHPTKVYFDKADRNFLSTIADHIAQHSPQIAIQEEEKFRDLIVILLNVVATQATPNFVREIAIPSVVLKDRDVNVCYLNLSDKVLTIGATLDAATLGEASSRDVERGLTHYNKLVEEDLTAAGGIDALFKEGKLKPRPEIDRILRSSAAYSATVAGRLLVNRVKRAHRVRRPKAALGAVPDGMAIGINEYFLDTLAKASLPKPVDDSTSWVTAGPVRGRALWWMRMNGADTQISSAGAGFKVTGGVDIDVGGALEGCIKKFWDCSWKWACGRLGLALRDRPEVSITLKDDGSGILLSARIVRMPRLEADLPFPFNKVVELVGELVLRAMKVILNLILAAVEIRVIPGAIGIPIQGHVTKMHLSSFNAFYYSRPTSGLGGAHRPEKIPFGAYAVAVESKN